MTQRQRLDIKATELRKIAIQNGYKKYKVFPTKNKNYLGVITVDRERIFSRFYFYIVDNEGKIKLRRCPFIVRDILEETKVFAKSLTKF